MKTNSAYRLLATSKLSPQEIQMSTVLHHLKQHKLKADFTDDDKNMVLVRGNMAQVLMGLSSFGWGHSEPEKVEGGLYTYGEAVTIEAQIPLRVMQTQIERVLITLHVPGPEIQNAEGE
jgi:hypothetical protein